MIPIDERDAKFIRVLRVDLGCTWGRIGELWEQMTGNVHGSGHQTSGGRLCEWACSILGENPGLEPWN